MDDANRTARLVISWGIPALVLLVVMLIITGRTGIPMIYFTRDFAATLQAPVYVGLISNLGVLVWASAAAISLFSAMLERRRGRHPDVGRLLFFGGILCAILALDDLFLMHEVVFPLYLGIPEIGVYAGYFILVSTFFAVFSKTILRTRYTLLGIAMWFFAVSLAVDFGSDIAGVNLAAEYSLEDWAKLFGIVFFCAYFASVSFTDLEPKPDDCEPFFETEPAETSRPPLKQPSQSAT